MATDLFEESFLFSYKKVLRHSKRVRDVSKSKSKEDKLDKWGTFKGGRKGRWEKNKQSKLNGVKNFPSGKRLILLELKEAEPLPACALFPSVLPKFLLAESDSDLLANLELESGEARPSNMLPDAAEEKLSTEDESAARTADGKTLPNDIKVPLADLFRAKIEAERGTSLSDLNLEMANRLCQDAVIQIIFRALFQTPSLRTDFNGEMKEYHGEADDEPDEINEPVTKAFLTLAIFSKRPTGVSRLLSFPHEEEAVLLEYLDEKMIYEMVEQLRYEDDRLPSVRLPVLKAIFRCVPARRLTMLNAVFAVASERLHWCRVTEERYRELSLDIEETSREGAGASPSRDQGISLVELVEFVITTLSTQFRTNKSAVGLVSSFDSSSLRNAPSWNLSARDGCSSNGDAFIFDANRALATLVRALLTLSKCHATSAGVSGEGELCALNQCFLKFAQGFPEACCDLTWKMVCSWPRNNTTREAAFIGFLETVMSVLSPCSLPLQQSIFSFSRLFSQIIKCITSLHHKVALAALKFCSNQHIISQYLIPNGEVLKEISSSLHRNNVHWNKMTREQSDKLFDFFLDFM